ncbi:hypothetical protein, conserved [Trypanosoma brucei brucei TREU927]|uniref:Uncharacterized protein n=1 Tax=Trypanosoma brucei brucei (strain 927/4 GUTat10.1) TaxID=185431 RepID=Q383X1_TRYB2|nr:hypothetical protein, conserved [Trypanosoma brucei brucei TREU927]EAN79910.1 hypothetical protein, conserved [Trypanosoma brucei brucei TREU927]
MQVTTIFIKCSVMGEEVLSVLIVVVSVVVVVTGTVFVASAGFLRISFGALIVSLSFSLVFSTLSSILLEASVKLPQESFPVALLRAILSAAGKQTVSGIALLALLFVVAAAAARACGLLEDIQILLDAHKAFTDEGDAEIVQR